MDLSELAKTGPCEYKPIRALIEETLGERCTDTDIEYISTSHWIL